MKYNLTDTLELIRNRRTIFPEQYSTRKVHKEQVENMLEAANWAPTHGLTEPWRFKVFDGDARRNFAGFMAETYKATTQPENFAEPKYNRMIERGERASYIIAVCMKRQESGRIPLVEEQMAVACAVQNMMLVATAYGIGTFWATPGFIWKEEIKDYLHLTGEDQCLGILYVGYPEGEWPKGKRNIWMNKVEWNE